MKKLAIMIAIVLIISMFSGCSKYYEKDFIGKTSVQIMEQYGPFDCTLMPADEDGYYRIHPGGCL